MIARAAAVVAKARKAAKDLNLLKALQSEISHEQSSSPNRYENPHPDAIGDFKLAWDAPNSRDVFLQKRCQSGEEVAVSALLGSESMSERFPWHVIMKVCIKKPGLSSILLFDCIIFNMKSGDWLFDVHRAYFLSSSVPPTFSDYRGPKFSTLDPKLQEELKKYLEAKGIGQSLVDFLLLHLHKKEQQQYLTWLQKLRDLHQEGK